MKNFFEKEWERGKPISPKLLASLNSIGTNDAHNLCLSLNLFMTGQDKTAQADAFISDHLGISTIALKDIINDEEAEKIFESNPAFQSYLFEKVKIEGVRPYQAIQVWDRGDGTYTLLDGYTIVAIARKLGIESISAVKRFFATHDDFMQARLDAQLDRRNITLKDKFNIVKRLVPAEIAKAKLRQGGKSVGQTTDSKGRADGIIGRRIGLCADTVFKIRKLLQAGDKDLLQKIFDGKLTINAAFESLTPDLQNSTDPESDSEPVAGNAEETAPAAAIETSHTVEKVEDNKKVEIEEKKTQCDSAEKDNNVAKPSVAKTLNIGDPLVFTAEIKELLELLVTRFPETYYGDLGKALFGCDPRVVSFVRYLRDSKNARPQ